MFDRIYLDEICSDLKLKPRAAKNFLKRHKIGLMKDFGCKAPFCLRVEYERAKNSVVLDYLKKKYGEGQLPETVRDNIGLITQLTGVPSKQEPPQYRPRQPEEIKFLERLQTRLKTTLII